MSGQASLMINDIKDRLKFCGIITESWHFNFKHHLTDPQKSSESKY